MKILLRFTILFLAFQAWLPEFTVAQISVGGSPWSKDNQVDAADARLIHMPSVPTAWEALLENDAQPDVKPFLFAWPVDTLINLMDLANIIYEDEDISVYQIRIQSQDALSLNLIFDQYYLPPGASMFLHDPEYKTIYGAYTELNNKPYRKLATTPVEGNELVVEVSVKKQLAHFEPQVVIGRISLDMVGILDTKSGYFGRSGDCNVDVNCPPGNDWQVLKRSVAKYIRGGNYLCSGALINNTANDGKPYLLTANHCIATETHARLSVYYFNYESPVCLGGDGRLDQSISGSTLISTSNKLDFALVELSVTPPESFQPFYAGWDRSVVPFYDTVTCIHHPSGDVKKISRANRRVVTGSFGGSYDLNTHWFISEWDIGTTEGGSSGSPLFNADQRIIGDLTGGDASCSYNYNDYFQKFSVSWDRYPENENQLKYWLDPESVGATAWNGMDPYMKDKPIANFTLKPVNPVAGKYVRFSDTSYGGPDEWKWAFEGGTPATSNERSPLVIFEEAGAKSIQLIVHNQVGSDTTYQTIMIGQRIDFTASQRRLVAGATTQFSNRSSEPFSNVSWDVMEGIQTWKSFNPGFEQVFLQNGVNDVTLHIEYGDESFSLFHQNFIKIIPEELIFSGKLTSVYSEKEALGIFSPADKGLIPGNNSMGYTAFANEFRFPSDTLTLATGIRLEILSLKDPGYDVLIKAVIWDAEWKTVKEETILLKPAATPFRATVWFDQPVGVGEMVYAGFEIPENPYLEFSSGMTLTRNESFPNHAWGRIDTTWRPLNQMIGLNSAIGVQLETVELFQNYTDRIRIISGQEYGSFTLDLSGLVYKSLDLDVFDLSGKKVISTTKHQHPYMNVQLRNAGSGIYLVNLRLDSISFTKKIMILRD